MAFAQEITAALSASGAFSVDDLKNVATAERKLGDIDNWPLAAFQDVFAQNPAQAVLAHNIVKGIKADVKVTEEQTHSTLPDRPPYLNEDCTDYDPHDSSQYWTDPATGEMWRWDGKGRGAQGGRSEITGETAPRSPYRYGEPHKVVLVKHTTVDGVRVPDEQEALDANVAEADWFHHGFNCWVGKGGKRYGEVTPAVRSRFMAAQARVRENGNNVLVRRQPRAA